MSHSTLPLDHLVLACRDLEHGVAALEDRLGVRMAPGGRHPGRGTRNRLLSVGETAFLEVVGVDPEQPPPVGPRWLGVDAHDEPTLVTWCAKGNDLGAVLERAIGAGIDLGVAASASRRRPDGSELAWRFTDPAADRLGGLLPFFIDWGGSPHPALGLERHVSFLGLRAIHPEPEVARTAFGALGLSVPVEEGPRPGLIATLNTPRGIVDVG